MLMGHESGGVGNHRVGGLSEALSFRVSDAETGRDVTTAAFGERLAPSRRLWCAETLKWVESRYSEIAGRGRQA
jgi:hypothetical protein